ncbi:LuxR C-terminal-related transcriptional regulator [Kitasatospora sp. NPDC056731]|uniref:LuxR C-terminal-related transcriptional regulator n=1 Tax=Kitasatospora sp. NPDC056731 TaxID=3155422 RepID=UPI0034290320
MTRPLTPRERDILRYTAQDLSVHTIAQALRITEASVRTTRSRACRALGNLTLDQAIQLINQPNGEQQ